jgi:hypothetical protein
MYLTCIGISTRTKEAVAVVAVAVGAMAVAVALADGALVAGGKEEAEGAEASTGT